MFGFHKIKLFVIRAKNYYYTEDLLTLNQVIHNAIKK